MKETCGIAIFLTAVWLLACCASNYQVHTGPPPREAPLDDKGAGPYQPLELPKSLTVDFEVPGNDPCSVRVELRNSGIKLVRTIVDSVYSPGRYSIEWDRTDSSGVVIREGLYFYQYHICGKTSTLRLDYRRRWE